MFERFDAGARRVVFLAQEEARALDHGRVGTEHILLGLTREGESRAAKVLANLRISPEAVRRQVMDKIYFGEQATGGPVPFTPPAKKVLELALREAIQLGHDYIGTEHILLGLIRQGYGVAAYVLALLDADLDRVRQHVIEPRSANSDSGERAVAPAATFETSAVLDEFGRNLIRAAHEHELDPVVGREEEMSRALQILMFRTRNNPLLIGGPGVGKRTIANGLADMIARDEAPSWFADRLVYTFDPKLLLGGVAAGDGPNDRLLRLTSEIQAKGNVILIIDAVFAPVQLSTGENDAVSLLKQPLFQDRLRRGENDAVSLFKQLLLQDRLRIVGTATPAEYQRRLELDPSLVRYFQPLRIDKPSLADTVGILKTVRARYEAHHWVSITDGALVAAARLADRYISDRFLPDKAIDLIDEAGSRMRIRRMTAPPDLREFDEKIANVHRDKESAIDAQDFEKAASLRDTEKQLQTAKAKREKECNQDDLDSIAEVDEQLIAEVAALRLGVPIPDPTPDADRPHGKPRPPLAPLNDDDRAIWAMS